MSVVEENNWNPNQDENQNQGSNQNSNENSRPNSGTGDNTAPFKITGNWGQQSTQLRNQYNELTDSDLDVQPGQENQLFDQIGTRLNKSRDEVMNILNQSNQNQGSNQNQSDQNQSNQDQSNRNESDQNPDKFTL